MQVTWRLEPGTLLEETYRLDESLGLTEAGERFRATDLRDDSDVIVTCLHPQLFEGKSRGPNTLRVQRSRAYAHAKVVAVRDIVLAGPNFYVVSDAQAGTPLERWVLGRLPLTMTTVTDLVSQIIAALEAIHLIGVHGNLKPANVYVSDEGELQLAEPWFLEGCEEVITGALLPRQSQWTAPEQRAGTWQERHESDVFLVGALVGWLVAGRAVAPGVSLIEQRVEVDERLDALLLKATADEPEERFHDVRVFWAELQGLLAQSDKVVPPLEEDEPVDGDLVEMSPPPLEVVTPPTFIEEDELEQTEAIPLAEIERMGLDAGIAADASHVDAILIVDGDDEGEVLDASELEELEPIPLVTDTSFIPLGSLTEDAEVVDAIVEVGIIDREAPRELAPASEERTVQVVPGPGSARALEAARLAEMRRKGETPLPSEHTIVGSAPTPGTMPPRIRTRAVYVAPFLALLAGTVMFWVLSQALDGPTSVEVTPSSSAETAPVSESPRVASAAETKESPLPSDPRGEASTLVIEQADAVGLRPEPDGLQASSVVDVETGQGDVKGPIAVADSASGDEAQAPKTASAEVVKVEPDPSRFDDMDASKLRCPPGMAKIRSRRKVTLPDGTTKKRKVVWCTDRYEFPGKGSVPTTNVTLAAAKQTCRARGRRLCRRTEWRGACGGAKYPYRGDYDASRCNTVAPGGIPRSVIAAGSKRRCKGGFGTYDMTGNVAEWTSDGSVNGGSAYKDGASATCYRSSRRTGGSPYVGFRCCADPIATEPKTLNDGDTP